MTHDRPPADRFSFRPGEPDDLPLLGRWRSAQHVVQWWGEPGDLAEVRSAASSALPVLSGSANPAVMIASNAGKVSGLYGQFRSPRQVGSGRLGPGAGA
jgi:hypothetical protein